MNDIVKGKDNCHRYQEESSIEVLPLNEIVKGKNHCHRYQEERSGVSNDDERRRDGHQVVQPPSQRRRHRLVHDVDVFAEAIQDATLRGCVKE